MIDQEGQKRNIKIKFRSCDALQTMKVIKETVLMRM